MTTLDFRPRAGTMLAVLLTGQAMASMDNSIVAVAAPAIRDDLGGSGAVQQLVLAGYTLAFAVLVVTGARIGSRYGYQRVFLMGLGGFTVTSLACGLAPGAAFLVGARIAQGAAAAIMTPQVLSLIQIRLDGAARTRAIGLYSMILALGVAAGQIVGGLVVSVDLGGLSWRPAFLVNVPVGLVLLVLGPRLLPAGTPTPARLDLTGVWLLSAAMVGVVLPLVLGREQGWPAWAWALPLGAGAALLAAFVRHERRVAAPLVDLTVLAVRPVRLGLAACCAVMGCYAAFLFALTLHLQDTLGFGALAAGLAFVPYATGFAASSLLARRLPARVVSVVGPLAFGAAALAVAGVGQTGWPWVLGSGLLLIGGAGHAAGFTPLVTRISPLIRPDQAASFSALVSTGALLASVLGVSALGAVYLGTGSFALVTVLIAALLCGGAVSASRAWGSAGAVSASRAWGSAGAVSASRAWGSAGAVSASRALARHCARRGGGGRRLPAFRPGRAGRPHPHAHVRIHASMAVRRRRPVRGSRPRAGGRPGRGHGPPRRSLSRRRCPGWRRSPPPWRVRPRRPSRVAHRWLAHRCPRTAIETAPTSNASPSRSTRTTIRTTWTETVTA